MKLEIRKVFPFIFKQSEPAVQKLRPIRDGSEDNMLPTLGLAYFLESNVSVFADIVLTLKQEVIRRGLVWKPRFAVKCTMCGCEYNEEVTICDCGSTLLRKPDRTQIMKFRNPRGESFIDSANLNNQGLETISGEVVRHWVVGDSGYVLCIKNYAYVSNGLEEQLIATPVEFLAIDPRDIKPIKQENGLLGGKYWVCAIHREHYDEKPGLCPVCGHEMHEALYETAGMGTGLKKILYIKNEVFFTPVYYPSLSGGFPPILRMLHDAYAYHWMELRNYNYHKKGRPPGFLAFPTANLESLNTQWETLLKLAQEDPDNVQALGFDPGQGKGVATFVQLMKDPGSEMLEVKKELRERMGSMFGVSMIFQADTSASGGLNNEGLQVTVTNRAVEFLQNPFNGREQNNYKGGLYFWMVSQCGITDFTLNLLPSEEQDEMAEKLRFNQDAQNAKLMLDMGYDVKFENNKFTFSGVAKKPDPPGQFGGMPTPAPAQIEAPRASGEPDIGAVQKYDESQPRANDGKWTDGGGGGNGNKTENINPEQNKPNDEMKPEEKKPAKIKAPHEMTREEFYKIPEKEKLGEIFNNEEIVNEILSEPDEYQRNAKLLEALENPNAVKDTVYWREELNEQPDSFRSKNPPKEGLEWEQTEGLLTFGTFYDAEEYGNLGIKQAPDKYVAYTGTKIKLHGQEADTGADEYLIENPRKIAEFSYDSLKGKHKAKVKLALKEGKKISDDVLADYPDLKQQFQKADIKNAEPDELDEYQGDQLIKDFAADALKAIRRGALYSFYKDVLEADIPIIHEIIKDAFLSHKLSLKNMVEQITEQTGLDETKARMIARTESTSVAMRAREMGWRKQEATRGEEFKYKAVITNDFRTSPISRRIKAAVDAEGGAVSMDRLKEIYREESTKPYIKGDPENSGMGADWTGWENFVGHPYERDSIVRVGAL